MPANPVIFVSHLSEEREAAIELRALLAEHYGQAASIFVSTDGTSIRIGDDWLKTISSNLKRCVAMVIVCSPESVSRPWIQFEAGAAWIRGVPVMPVCIGGMTPRNLPDPLNRLEAVDARDPKDLRKFLRSLGEAVGVVPARIRCDKFAKFAVELLKNRAAGPLFPKLYPVSADIHNDLPQMIRATRKSLVMSGIHFNISLTNRFDDYLNALLSGVNLRISVVRPESPAVTQLAILLGENPKVLRSECKLTHAVFEKLADKHREHASSRSIGRLELRLAERAPSARVYLFDHEDETGQVLFTPYLHLKESVRSPSLLFHQNHSVYPAFVEAALSAAESGEVYFDSARASARSNQASTRKRKPSGSRR